MEWIDINEKLPENYKEVLIWIRYSENPCQAFRKDNNWYVSSEVRQTADDGYMNDATIRGWNEDNITHWMLLPAPPKTD